MNTKENTVNSNVETLDINLDEIFNGTPGAGDITLPKVDTNKKKHFFWIKRKTRFFICRS